MCIYLCVIKAKICYILPCDSEVGDIEPSTCVTYLQWKGRHGRDRMVVEFITTHAISDYHY
jgi:hypothetical protein